MGTPLLGLQHISPLTAEWTNKYKVLFLERIAPQTMWLMLYLISHLKLFLLNRFFLNTSERL